MMDTNSIYGQETLMKAFIIPADPQIPMREESLDGSLSEFQRLVGGDVQMIGLRESGVCAYINEEGKIQGLPFNVRATQLFEGSLMRHDFISGDMILVGAADEEGNDTDLSGEQIEMIHAGLRHRTQ